MFIDDLDQATDATGEPWIMGDSQIQNEDGDYIYESHKFRPSQLNKFITEIDPEYEWLLYRNTFRGKNLGNQPTDAQYDAIEAGDFSDLRVGDYWEVDGNKWRIADINYWLGTGEVITDGSILCTTNHLVIVPDNILYSDKMNTNDTSSTGYLNSYMRTTGLNQAKSIINNIFGQNHILNHRDVFSSQVTYNNYIFNVSSAYADSTVELLDASMISSEAPTTSADRHVQLNKTTLSLFSMIPNSNIGEGGFWLRNVYDMNGFMAENELFVFRKHYTNSIVGVRPVFGICKSNGGGQS